jgi:carbamoyltransferase
LTVKDSFEIAAATQFTYESFLLEVLGKAQKLTNSKNLVLMGGCALNCLANRLTGRFFDKTWIMPNPGDAGSSVGAVLAHTKKHIGWNTSLLGYDMGYRNTNSEIVEYIQQNKMCGVARGPAEFGPRALGNRSLLADPRDADIKDRVNEIKQRQQFRPFAPAILEELVNDYFDLPYGWDSSRYMQTVAHCKNPDLFPAIVHKDGTSRVQTVPNDGTPFRKLLEQWYAATGCPMLLNTSLNIRGKPMVNDHADARAFERQYKIRVFN